VSSCVYTLLYPLHPGFSCLCCSPGGGGGGGGHFPPDSGTSTPCTPPHGRTQPAASPSINSKENRCLESCVCQWGRQKCRNGCLTDCRWRQPSGRTAAGGRELYCRIARMGCSPSHATNATPGVSLLSPTLFALWRAAARRRIGQPGPRGWLGSTCGAGWAACSTTEVGNKQRGARSKGPNAPPTRGCSRAEVASISAAERLFIPGGACIHSIPQAHNNIAPQKLVSATVSPTTTIRTLPAPVNKSRNTPHTPPHHAPRPVLPSAGAAAAPGQPRPRSRPSGPSCLRHSGCRGRSRAGGAVKPGPLPRVFQLVLSSIPCHRRWPIACSNF